MSDPNRTHRWLPCPSGVPAGAPEGLPRLGPSRRNHEMFRWRHRRGKEPHGVRICHGDGRISNCDLIRDLDDDPEGRAQWIAQLPPGVVVDLAAGDVLAVAYLPARTSIVIGLLAVDGWAEDLILGFRHHCNH